MREGTISMKKMLGIIWRKITEAKKEKNESERNQVKTKKVT